MVDQLFSDRERGPRPRTSETVDDRTWGGLVAQINQRVANGNFGLGFPEECPDREGTIGCDGVALGMALQAEVDIEWPLRADRLPDDQLAIWDALEFLFEYVGKPIAVKYHSYFGHHHLSFDVEAGQEEFAASVNRLLARNGIAFALTEDGQVRRLLPEHVGGQIARARFQTGDAETNRLLEAARVGITSRSLENRRDGLEKLWDAFERLKTLEPGSNKNSTAEALLNQVKSGPAFRVVLGEEAKALSSIGNTFRIRHSEAKQEILQTAEQVDYLFFRMFAFLQLLLRSSGRGG
jgi:hypothetical protein